MDPAPNPPEAQPAAPLLRIQFMSDLHIEFARALELLPKWTAAAPVLALLGDIGKVNQDKYKNFIEAQAKMFEQVLVLFGNHDIADNATSDDNRYYGGDSYDTLMAETRTAFAHLKNVTFMQKTVITIGGVCILGTTLWTDVPEEDAGAVSRALNDYLVIRVGTGKDKRRITVADTNAWHRDERTWLEKEIAAAKSRNQPVVVLTHHAPLRYGTSAPKFDGNQVNVAFATALDDMMGPPVVAWLYGHTHYNNEQTKKGTLVTCNQVGYVVAPGERVGFEPFKILEVTATGTRIILPAVPSPDARPPMKRVSVPGVTSPAAETADHATPAAAPIATAPSHALAPAASNPTPFASPLPWSRPFSFAPCLCALVLALRSTIDVKRLSPHAVIPRRATQGAAGYDLAAAQALTIPPREHAIVFTDISVKLPIGTYGRIALGAGVIDPDYRGNVGVILFNHGSKEFVVNVGDRIAQLILERVALPEVREVTDLDGTERAAGGFGSTGVVSV